MCIAYHAVWSVGELSENWVPRWSCKKWTVVYDHERAWKCFVVYSSEKDIQLIMYTKTGKIYQETARTVHITIENAKYWAILRRILWAKLNHKPRVHAIDSKSCFC